MQPSLQPNTTLEVLVYFCFGGGGVGGEIEYINLFIHVCDRKGLGQFNPLRFPVSSTLTIRNSCLYKRLTNRNIFCMSAPGLTTDTQ